ncbi:MAG: hypothetical protein ACK4HN_06465 [Thermosynechococcus sp.]|uniref:hypothetical protein n=1 Tax=Thermosynechococcus sp. TaxID=2814275 RepID=UPI0039188625
MNKTNESLDTKVAKAALGTVAGIATTVVGESIPVAVVSSTVPASGIAGWLGFTTTATTVVTLPTVGVLALAALVGYGIYKGLEAAQNN